MKQVSPLELKDRNSGCACKETEDENPLHGILCDTHIEARVRVMYIHTLAEHVNEPRDLRLYGLKEYVQRAYTDNIVCTYTHEQEACIVSAAGSRVGKTLVDVVALPPSTFH